MNPRQRSETGFPALRQPRGRRSGVDESSSEVGNMIASAALTAGSPCQE